MGHDHQINGRIGAHRRWSTTTKTDRIRQTEAARGGLYAKFEREVDPDGHMSPADRAKAADHKFREHMNRMARASAAARRRQNGTPGKARDHEAGDGS